MAHFPLRMHCSAQHCRSSDASSARLILVPMSPLFSVHLSGVFASSRPVASPVARSRLPTLPPLPSQSISSID
ncbi:hypothetical protein BDQ12DRAFT_683653 [Crucibulum laeve]|uniref:Uncharacterized protein n=1 Tax=Crucibulum laeve TaxID=68775 RepID=A0A5C3M142_9AGAR|nr:hypothetical protein BDQ12DRAFT_683653 [Crucibulum laeve]